MRKRNLNQNKKKVKIKEENLSPVNLKCIDKASPFLFFFFFVHFGKRLTVSEGGEGGNRGGIRAFFSTYRPAQRGSWHPMTRKATTTMSSRVRIGGDGEGAGEGDDGVTQHQSHDCRPGRAKAPTVASSGVKAGWGSPCLQERGERGAMMPSIPWIMKRPSLDGAKRVTGARPGGEDRQIHDGHDHGELLKAELAEDRGQEEGLVHWRARRREEQRGRSSPLGGFERPNRGSWVGGGSAMISREERRAEGKALTVGRLRVAEQGILGTGRDAAKQGILGGRRVGDSEQGGEKGGGEGTHGWEASSSRTRDLGRWERCGQTGDLGWEAGRRW